MSRSTVNKNPLYHWCYGIIYSDYLAHLGIITPDCFIFVRNTQVQSRNFVDDKQQNKADNKGPRSLQNNHN
ncbi:hypothetical protein RvY_06345 [Ramazzottius varieornatus]|uniref:Uncharacterized protein n=1 Tax=Ramazzottius varieornatus TaxID=947166 RepID=A0A1D1V1R1_RAMVA|nr:hypothetical protein RvY_06345 [Ramazzottius varieornatus]